MSDLGVTLDDLVRTLRARNIRVPAEIGTFVALECCERLERAPAEVTMRDVRVSEEGLVSVFAAPGSASSELAARSVVAMLAALLVAAGTAVPTPLVGLVESGGPCGPDALRSLRDQLEAALVPLNRQAARRVLSRMIREARRPKTDRPPPPTASVDDALDELLSDEGSFASRQAPVVASGLVEEKAEGRVPSSDRQDVSGDEGAASAGEASLQRSSPSVPAATPVLERPVGQGSMQWGKDQAASGSELGSAARHAAVDGQSSEGRRGPRPVDLTDDSASSPRASRMGLWLSMLLAASGCAALYVAVRRPDLIDAWLGRSPSSSVVEPTPVRSEPEVGVLEVTSTPPRAQVLLYVGRGPVVVENLPMGVAHEFVVLAEGHRPQRALVPFDAAYEPQGAGPPRYELAVQAGAAVGPSEQTAMLELGPSLWTSSPGPSGPAGQVRVVTNPPGAKVYMLVGFTPDVRIENQPTREAVELLVWVAEHRAERVVVGPSDWQGPAGERRAVVQVTLTPLGRR